MDSPGNEQRLEQEVVDETTSPDATPEQGAGESPGAIGDQVLDLLQDVEAQFDRLKNVQETHAEDLESIADRTAAMDDREREFSERLHAAESARAGLERQRAELDTREAEHRGLAERLESHDALLRQREEELQAARGALDERQAAVTSEEAALSSQVDESNKTIEALRSELEGLTSRLGERNELVAAKEEQLKSLTARIESSNETQARVTGELDSARDASTRLQEQVAALGAELDEHRQRNEQQQAIVKAAQQETELLRLKLEKAEGQLARELGRMEELTRHREDQEGKVGSLNEELATARRRVETVEGELRSQAELLEQRDARIAEQAGMISDLEQKLELAGTKLRKFSELIKAHGPKLEQGAIAVATVAQQRQQIERITEELAQSKLAGQPEELTRRDQRIRDLTEALKQARGQTGADADIEAMEARNAELTARVDEMRLALEKAELAADETQRQLEERSVEAAGEGGDAETARLVLECQEQSRRIAELEQQIEAAGASGEDAASPIECAHLRRRQQRLRAIRVRMQKTKEAAAATEELRQRLVARGQEFDSEQRRLDEVKLSLAETEKTMVRRWARPQAITVTGWFIFMLCIAAAGSWFGAGALRPPRVVASVSIIAAQAADGDDAKLADTDLEAWQKHYTRLLADPTLHAAVVKRCSDLQFVSYLDPATIDTMFVRDLSVDASQPGRLTLSLVGDSPREAVRMLDLLATTLVSESASGVAEAPAESIVLGERHERGRVTYASLGPVPVEDHRMEMALPLFAAGVIFIALIFMLVVRRLHSARRFLRNVHSSMIGSEEVAVIVP